MPAMVRPVTDERDGLLCYLAQQRDLIRVAAHGLDDVAAAATPSASAFSLGGLVKHVAGVEQYWMDLVAGRTRTEAGSHQDGLRLGFSSTSSRRPPGMPATPTSSASRWTAPPRCR